MDFSKINLLKTQSRFALKCLKKYSSSMRTKGRVRDNQFEFFFPSCPSNSIEGKTALVVGGTSGIGLNCVHQLLENGGVMIADCDETAGKNIMGMLCEYYGPDKVTFIRTNTSKAKFVRNTYESTLKHWKELNVVINDIQHRSRSNWSKEIDENVKPIVLNTLIALEYMGTHMGHNGGVIINIVSKCMVKEENMPLFIGAQHFLTGFNSAFSKRCYETTGVKVTSLCPRDDEPCDLLKLLATLEEDH